jgi:hypothetical protein
MLHKFVAAAALGAAVFVAGPAGAQGWYNDGYQDGWRGSRSDHYGPGGNYPSWGVQNGPRTDVLGWNGARYGYDGYDYRGGAGAGVAAVCPAGYHLGRNGSLCWPD